jgi:hypothetical protein
MGYQQNNKAYELFIQIEVGIREFLINLIIQKGVKNWINTFLSKNHLETLKEISLRIREAEKNQELPDIEDSYIYKLHRTKRALDSSPLSQFYHPFYYLNWTDLESLIRLNSNAEMIDERIGRINKERLADIINLLGSLRNDVAHSRFISDNDLNIIQGAFNQITGLIPNFSTYINCQSQEDALGVIASKLTKSIENLEQEELISQIHSNELNEIIEKCINSFWLNSFYRPLVLQIVALQKELINYEILRKKPGCILDIKRWKVKNIELISDIKNIIKNGKI